MARQNAITVQQLTQVEADRLMKALEKEDAEAFSGFLISFDGEKKRVSEVAKEGRKNKRLPWALPSDERVYYLAKYEGKPYLLVGMSSYDTISSLAKITSSLSGKGGECFKALIEKELVFKCFAGVIYIDFGEDCDPAVHKLLLKLKDNLPEGIEDMFVYHNAASIICKAKSDAAWNEKTA